MSSNSGKGLGHLKVVELCNPVTGAYCAKLLADLGAEVIKVEPPGSGDKARQQGPFLDNIPHPECSGLFLYLNTNKLGVTLDVTTSTGLKVLKELIAQADVFVQDNSPAVTEKLGLAYEELRRINPRLVMSSITPFGQTGPYREYKAYELNSYHAGGEGYLLPIQSPDLSREPVKAGGHIGDFICGLSAALATLAATYRMRATGLGQHLDISKQDMLMTMVLLELVMYPNMGFVRNRIKRPVLMPIPMECEDGYIQMSALTEREWNDIVEFMGYPSWAKDERFKTWLERHLYGDEINPHIEDWTQQYKKDELFAQLQEKAISAAPVNTSEDVVKSPQFAARGFFNEISHPKAGNLKQPGVPYKFSKTPLENHRPAPLLGQHNEQIFCERLGYSNHDLVKMRETGVI